MNSKSAILVLLFASFLSGCSDALDSDKTEQKPLIEVESVSAESIGTDVGRGFIMLKGRASIDPSYDVEGEAFFYFSDKFSKAKDIMKYGDRIGAGVVSGIKSDFSAELWTSKPLTQYRYIAAVNAEGIDYYGKVGTFKTFGLLTEVWTVDMGKITTEGARIGGALVYDMSLGEPELFFLYSPESKQLEYLKENGKRLEGEVVRVSETESICQFEATISGMEKNKEYYFVAGAIHDGKEYYGRISFVIQ